MRLNKYLFIIFPIVFIFIFAFFAANELKAPHSGSPEPTVLALSEYAGTDYLDKLYFVGDSTTYHFYKGGIALSHILVPSSYTLKLSSDILSLKVGETQDEIPLALANANAEIAILTIGVNGSDSFTEKQYKSYYRKLIEAIKTTSPNTKLIIQSVFPVTKWYSDLDMGITNEGINRINLWGYELAKEMGLRYLDTQSVLKDSDGAQKLVYSENDGVHLNALGYGVILEYIATHAIE